MAKTTAMSRPKRWDSPYDPTMRDSDFAMVMAYQKIQEIDKSQFPDWIPLEGIIRNDTRVVRYHSGDIIIRKDDYGNSTFLIIDGQTRVVVNPPLAEEQLGRKTTQKRGFFSALSQLFTNSSIPESRDTHLYKNDVQNLRLDSGQARAFLPNIKEIIKEYQTASLGNGTIMGEIAALSRVPRTATVFAETESTLLEIRWQGLREIRRYDESWRQMIDNYYRQNALKVHLQNSSLFNHLDPKALEEITQATLFETYGSFDWHLSFKNAKKQDKKSEEPIVAHEGEYPDGLFMIRAGLARVSVQLGTGQKTLTYLQEGDTFGLDEVYYAWKNKGDAKYKATLTALSYVDILRVPSHILEKHIFPNMPKPKSHIKKYMERKLSDSSLLEWAVDERFINGTKTMLINMDRCVRCDDCVRACSDAHDGNPRFVRHGKQVGKWMVANACMHCSDPICMIGCPTGAISRTIEGVVKINDITCIGCEVCANSCPFNNIRLVEIKDSDGNPVIDKKNQQPIRKATNCDLCIEQPSGPACVRSCPHDALERIEFRDHPQLYLQEST